LYRRSLQLEPDNYQALVELADVLSRRDNWPEAITLYRQAIERNPADLAAPA
jgi:tetratricopeptide (TPR) repeat protein